jgi:hypothetical protein
MSLVTRGSRLKIAILQSAAPKDVAAKNARVM